MTNHTSNEHTPGPWMVPHLADDECKCNCTSIVEGNYAGGIGQVFVDNGIKMITDGGNDCPPLNEAMANARLMAMAPEMFEALSLLVACKDQKNSGFAWLDFYQKNKPIAWGKARAVISKVKGRN